MAQITGGGHIAYEIFRKLLRPAASVAYSWMLLFRAFPAETPYHFVSWTTENGLPQNSISALHQTRDGYLWLSTLDGLVRFDGLHFQIFNRQNTPAMTGNSFTFFALLEDRQGCLWAGTVANGVVRYCNGIFTSLTVQDGLPNNSVVRIDEDEQGAVWIFTNPGLAKWQNGHLIRVAPEPGSPFSPSYLMTSKNNLGVDGALFGLWRMDANGWERFAYGHWSRFPLPSELKDPSKLRVVSSIEDSRHRFWYKLADSSTVYCADGGNLIQYRGIPFEYVVTYKDRRGYLWAYSAAGRCILWKQGRSIPLPDFSTPFMYRVLEDREGTVWIGTSKEGLYRADPQAITMYQHPHGPQ
jgi:ligand-binding sensor domain-containing protein